MFCAVVSTTLDLEADGRNEFQTPLAQDCLADGNAVLQQKFLHDSQAEVEVVGERQCVMNRGDGEAILSVTNGVGEVSGHHLERISDAPR
jgi:hypothetical protein